MIRLVRTLSLCAGMAALVTLGCAKPDFTDESDPLPTVFHNEDVDPSLILPAGVNVPKAPPSDPSDKSAAPAQSAKQEDSHEQTEASSEREQTEASEKDDP